MNKVISMFIILIIGFFVTAFAAEICEERDLYNLSEPGCTLDYLKGKYNKTEVKDIMFEIMKTYPYENKEKFEKVLERKIEVVDSLDLRPEKKEDARKKLVYHLGRVRAATKDNWENVRDAARRALEDIDAALLQEGREREGRAQR